jgi:hypothetical protein
MPFGGFLNAVPPVIFMLIHLTLFIMAVVFARRALGAGRTTLGRAFTLYAAAEVFYLSYHLDWTVFLFAHTVAEVLTALAVILAFTAGVAAPAR